MENETYKFDQLLKLLDNCRNKIYGLYNLFLAKVTGAKEDSNAMGLKYSEILNCKQELDITSANKGANGRMKDIKKSIDVFKNEFLMLYDRFKSALDECVGLRKTYKTDVVNCCNTYKILKGGKDYPQIEKGYRTQVSLIRKILDKINQLIEVYNKENAVVDERYSIFKKIVASLDKTLQSAQI